MLRLIHNLGGCGGTVLSRCLAVLPNVALLSEINPLSVTLFPAFDPLFQDANWLHLLKPEDLQQFSGWPERRDLFGPLIALMHKRAEEAGRCLILRDYNYIEFMGVPYIEQPPQRLLTAQALGDLPKSGIAFIRHPISQWLSLSKHKHVQELLPPGRFLAGYARFLEAIGDMPVFRYEDFVFAPDAEMRRICEALNLDFDASFQVAFSTYDRVTGDFTRHGESRIGFGERTPVPETVQQTFEGDETFQRILALTGYTSDWIPASSRTAVAPGSNRIPQNTSCPTGTIMRKPLAEWACEMALLGEDDRDRAAGLPGINMPLDRARLAAFLTEFAGDSDVRDLLLLDLFVSMAGAPVSSTGIVETAPSLILRPFRLWEYTWLCKGLRLTSGGFDVLDLGGPASHPAILAALSGNRVVSIDINPAIVEAGRACARLMKLDSLDARVGDMRDLGAFAGASFDVVLCCSVLEHLTAADQERALREAGRLLRPGGRIGLTFDYGPSAAGANKYLPPPHEPPASAAEAIQRYRQPGLVVLGNQSLDDPVPGSLFRDDAVSYTMAALFLGKPPVEDLPVPRPVQRSESKVSPLVIDRLPHRLYENAMRLQDAQERAAALHTASAERLAELHTKEAALTELHAEAARRGHELERAVATVHEQQARIESLEATAAERLAELHTKEAALAGLHAEGGRAVAAVHEQQARIESLEATAAERLAELHTKEAALAGLHAEGGRRAQELERAVATVREQQARIESLEATAAERLRQLEEARTAAAVIEEQRQALELERNRFRREFEQETLGGFLRRRWTRRK